MPKASAESHFSFPMIAEGMADISLGTVWPYRSHTADPGARDGPGGFRPVSDSLVGGHGERDVINVPVIGVTDV